MPNNNNVCSFGDQASDHEGAKEWAHCVNSLKESLESMYEICRRHANIMACEEAIFHLNKSVREFTSLIEVIQIEHDWDQSKPPHSIAWEVKGPCNKDEEWQVVKSHKRRKQSESGSGSGSERNTTKVDEGHIIKAAAGKHQQNAGRLTLGASSMSLPQTKTSLSRMAYSRQLLWQKQKKQLVELVARRRQERSFANANRRRSMPLLITTQPSASKDVGRTSRATSNKENTIPITARYDPGMREGSTNLESINEEEDVNQIDNTSTKTMPGGENGWLSKSEPIGLLDDLNGDEEWKVLTEEEESLTQEEESLKREIQSIDDLQRQCENEDFLLKCEALNTRPASWKEAVSQWNINANDDEEVKGKPTNKKPIKEVQQQYKKPGELAQFRAKIMSPSHKRPTNDKDIEERQRKAEEMRLTLQDQKTARLAILNERVNEVRRKVEEVRQRKQLHLATRMEKAEENRRHYVEIRKIKAKEDQSIVIATAFISQLEAENVKAELMRANDQHQERLNQLALERERREVACEERRRLAEKKRLLLEEKRVDRLAQALIKKQQQMSTHSLEMAEKLRQKAAQKLAGVEMRKAAEAESVASLSNRISQKHNDGLRRHEETLEQLKQKAIDSRSPRPQHPWVALADFAHMPSSDEGCKKQCRLCQCELYSDIQVLSHVLSNSHLLKAGDIDLSDIDFELVKSQLEHFIGEAEEASQPLLVDSSPVKEGTPTSTVSTTNGNSNKKRRAKLRQKLMSNISTITTNDQAHAVDLPPAIQRPLKALLSQPISSGSGDSKQLLMVHRKIAEIHRLLINSATSTHPSIAATLHQSGLVDRLLELCHSNYSHQAKLIIKSLHLMGSILGESQLSAQNFFHSNSLIKLADIICQSQKESIIDAAVACSVLTTVLSSVQQSLDANSTSQRIGLLLQYLFVCGFNELFTNHNFTEFERWNGTHQTVFEALMDVACQFLHSTTSTIKQAFDTQVQLAHTILVPLTKRLYQHFQEEKDAALRDEKHLLLMARQFLRLWNEMGTLRNSPPDECFSLRLLFIFHQLLRTDIKSLLLYPTIEAIGHFVSLNKNNRSMMLLGWQQHSLLTKLCMLPFECLTSEEYARVLMPTLIVVLYKNERALEIINNEFCLERLTQFMRANNDDSNHNKYLMQLLPVEEQWTEVMEFFASLK